MKKLYLHIQLISAIVILCSSVVLFGQEPVSDFESLYTEIDAYNQAATNFYRSYEEEIRLIIPNTEKKLLNLKREFKELDCLFYINEINTFRQGLIYCQMLNLSEKLEKTLYSVNSKIAFLDDDLQLINDIESRLDQIESNNNNLLSGKKKLKEEFNSQRLSLRRQKQKLADLASVMHKELIYFKERVKATKHELKTDYEDYIFNSYFSVLNPMFWKIAFLPIFDIWWGELPGIIMAQLPLNPYDWLLLISFVLIITLPLRYFGRIYFRKKGKDLIERNPDAWRYMIGSYDWLLLSLTLMMTSFYVNLVVFQFFGGLSQIFICLFALHLSWGIKLFLNHERPTKLPPPFSPLLGLFVVILLFRFFAVEVTIVAILWPVALIVGSFSIIKRMRRGYLGFEYFMFNISLIILLLSLITLLFGYYYGSLLIVLIWFFLTTGLQFGISLTKFSRHYIYQKQNSQHIFGFVIAAIGVPLLWLALISGFTIWLSVFFHVRHLLFEFIKQESHYFGIEVSCMDLFQCVLLFLLFRFIINLIQYFNDLLIRRKDANNDFQYSVVTFLSYLLWAIYLLICLNLLGVSYTSILVVLGGMSVGIGFGLQHIVENFFSGLILLFGKDLRPGDIVEINGMWGHVLNVNIRATVLKTYDNAIVTLSNSQILSSDFKNWTLNSPIARRDIKVGVAYGSDVDTVRKILLEVAAANEHVLKKPAPTALFIDFGDHALIFYLRFWLKDVDRNVSTQSELRWEIERKFKENGIEIAFNQLDLHIKEPGNLVMSNAEEK